MAPFQYAYDPSKGQWAVIFDGNILAWFPTEDEAAKFCARENNEQRSQDLDNEPEGSDAGTLCL